MKGNTGQYWFDMDEADEDGRKPAKDACDPA
jgi:hypothetical protein